MAGARSPWATRQFAARGLLAYYSGYGCSHSIELTPAKIGQWPDRTGLSRLDLHLPVSPAVVAGPTSGRMLWHPKDGNSMTRTKGKFQ
ncbi:hypothetical protein ACVIWU_006789 [Bradyrhizobium sp. USDA 4509]